MSSMSDLGWGGRHDGDGAAHARWHELVRSAGRADGTAAVDGPGSTPAPGAAGSPQGTEAAGSSQGAGAVLSPQSSGATPVEHLALLGFRSDEGVRRNAGRVGAKEGPTALRRALSSLALHGPLGCGTVALVDHGDVETVGEDLEDGQQRAADAVRAALDAPGNRLTIVLGGGHETAWPSYQGLLASARMRPGALPTVDDAPAGSSHPSSGARPRWGVLNLDAHFDLREAPAPTSGTPFAQMAAAEQAEGRDLAYAVLGIAEPSNTAVLFSRAEQLGVRWMTDLEVLEGGREAVTAFIEEFVADLDVLYLTIDLDVLPAATAPGVSAPAALGVDAALILHAVRVAAASGKLALLDVVELNPTLDVDQHTARAAARLIHEAAVTVTAR